MAQENSPIPSLIKGVEIPQEGARPKLDDVKSSSSEMPDQLDAFYEDLSDVDEVAEDHKDVASEPANPPQKVTEPGDQTISNRSFDLGEFKGNLVLYKKQLVATAVASNMLGVVMGFGGSQFWTTGPEITSLQVLSNLPPTVVVPLLDQEDEAPAQGGTGEPNQTGSREEKLVPLVPLPDLPESSIRQASADPPAELDEKPGPIVEEPVLVEVREENPTEDEKPAPPPVTVAPPPAIRNDKINENENFADNKFSKQIDNPDPSLTQPKIKVAISKNREIKPSSLNQNEPTYLVQLASCITENCVLDFQKIMKRLYPELPVRVVPYTSRKTIIEVVSREAFTLEDGNRLVEQLNRGNQINSKAYLESVRNQFQLVLGQIPKGQKPEELVKKMNNLFRGEVSFIKKSTEQTTKYFRVQVPAFDDRQKAVALQKELQKADKQMSSAFLVPNPNKP
ncbi:MAG: SPOR domain-containing protein [bacterium]